MELQYIVHKRAENVLHNTVGKNELWLRPFKFMADKINEV